MQIRDLGTLDAPLLAFGGPCSNLQATQALIARARALAIPPQRCLCTGDTVAYCAHPAETVAELRAFGCPVAAGNVDRQIAAGADACGCGFTEGSACDLASTAWYARASGRADAEVRRWMADLPDILTFRLGGRRGAVIHGGVTSINRYLWPSSPVRDFKQEIAALAAVAGPVDMVVAGHSGVAFARQVGGVLWINAGAIGLPPHDGRPETRFAILDAAGTPVFHRLCYDQTAAMSAMRHAGLTQGYERSLVTGTWPSEDMLPREMRTPIDIRARAVS